MKFKLFAWSVFVISILTMLFIVGWMAAIRYQYVETITIETFSFMFLVLLASMFLFMGSWIAILDVKRGNNGRRTQLSA